MFDIDRRMLVTVVIAVLISFGLGYQYGVYIEGKRKLQEHLTRSEVSNQSTQQAKYEPARIYVYVVGEVLNPGVQEMEEGARAYQAVERAKPGENADLSAINLAALVRDGEKIVVPRVGNRQWEHPPVPSLIATGLSISTRLPWRSLIKGCPASVRLWPSG